MSATESLSIGLGRGIPVPPPIRDEFFCEMEEYLDMKVNWTSPIRPSYQCIRDQDNQPACVRRGTFGGAPGGFGMSANTTLLAPRATMMFPSCRTCMDACFDFTNYPPK
jgi:hypothetical protein